MKIFLFTLLISISQSLFSQGQIEGKISSKKIPVEFASVGVEGAKYGTTTNKKGDFVLSNLPFGTHLIKVSHLSFNDTNFKVTLTKEMPLLRFNIAIKENSQELDEFVITGTRTEKRKTESAIIVNVINSKTLDNVQACNLSEGLKFQPGLRVETDCQTCNYTQLRINGLAGGYSQILINGRPIFSPLTSLYGLEQIPVNMIDRVEVIRGGGSSLYGSSAIGGTVNVITKIPKENNYELNFLTQSVNQLTSDNIFSGNGTLLTKKKNAGVSIFLNQRKREAYDHNNDNYSELPELNNVSVGLNSFLLIGKNQKLELSLSKLYEYRYGGEMVDKPAFKALQSEERTHNVWMGSADYQINFNEDKSSFITYGGWQRTTREHYTGIVPDETDTIAFSKHNTNPPYGTSLTSTFQGGFQLNHKLTKTLGIENVLTFGAEYLLDDVFDEIQAYNYLIDQTTHNVGLLAQSDWKLTQNLNLLVGVRMDKHNLVTQPVLSPRGSLLYTFKKNTQFRFSYGSGFRAPQAFDTDLHIAFSGGGISRVQLSPNLLPERSHSFSGSVNYDKVRSKYIVGFTLESFYTRLNNAFFLDPIGEDSFGEVFEKKNGQGATVQGMTLELRANYNTKIQIESGLTLQKSEYDNEIAYIDELPGIKEFIRTPNFYGYGILTLFPNSKLNGVVNYIHTGKMKIPHFAGAPNQLIDEIETTNSFNEISVKMNYTISVKKIKTKLNFYAGIKNITNSYQTRFDIGKNRDSNYVFGPSQPRTFYVGIKLLSF
mgnify:FL=1|jgi:outer membrane receptor for ferrienterochelin and colicins